MSVLVDFDILSALTDGRIVIEPFDEEALGTNSYDVHLAPTLRIYDTLRSQPLDVREKTATCDIAIGERGLVLEPGELYLASTIEYTESHAHVPILNGKSSLGRLGLSIHVTAGTGDVGFCNHWTMELFVIKPLRIYAGMPIGQLLWFTASREPMVPYAKKTGAKYTDVSTLPQASEMARNFRK
jgi:dCTP deaminase